MNRRGTTFIAVAVMAMVLAVLGCGETGPAEGPPADLRGSTTVPPGVLVTSAPVPLSDRPIDLAVFSEDEVAGHVQGAYATVLGHRYKLPWLKKQPDADQPPCWIAATPLRFTLDLGRASYISYVVVEPFTEKYGVGNFTVKILSDKNEEFDTEPPCKVSATPKDESDFDKAPEAFHLRFSPRYAQRLRFYFNRGSGSDTRHVYIKKIRVLGRPADGPGIAESPPLLATLREELDTNATNLALFDPEAVEQHVIVSDDKYPNGRFDRPWTRNDVTSPEEIPIPPYWCAPGPAWAEVDLGKKCYVDAITVQPYSEPYGLGAFYGKVVDDAGNELDTTPPCEDSEEPLAPPGTGLKPLPLAAKFDPVLTQKLKLYFPRGGFQNNWVYIEEIEVRGIAAADS